MASPVVRLADAPLDSSLRQDAIAGRRAEDLFGEGWQDDERFRMIYSGRDFSPYAVPEDCGQVRGVARPAPGRLRAWPCRSLLLAREPPVRVRSAAELFSGNREPGSLLVGDGPDEPGTKALAAEPRYRQSSGVRRRPGGRSAPGQGRDGRVHLSFAPRRPRHGRGRGPGGGAACVIASTMPEEIDVVPELIHRLPLTRRPSSGPSASSKRRRRTWAGTDAVAGLCG